MVAPSNEVTTNPDPTEAVKEALTLAIKNLAEKIASERMADAKAVVLARTELERQLTAMILTIDGKFASNKDLVDQLAKANAVALTAALQTQKESAAKSEVAIGDVIKQLQAAFETANKTTNEKIDRLTSRMDTGEDWRRAGSDDKQSRSTDRGQNISITAVLVSTGLLALAAMTFIAARMHN